MYSDCIVLYILYDFTRLKLSSAALQVSDAATRAFFLYGGEPEYNYGTNPALATTLGPGMTSSAQLGASYIAGAPTTSQQQQYMSPSQFSTPAPGER